LSFYFYFFFSSPPKKEKEMAANRVFVIGVGMTRFEKPGNRDWDYPDMAKEAVTKALVDAGVQYTEIKQACIGYCYGSLLKKKITKKKPLDLFLPVFSYPFLSMSGDSTCGQRAVYELGLTGIPVYNVNNNCSTGSTALFMSYQLVGGGISDCALALGFEKMERGSLSSRYNDRTNPLDKHFGVMVEQRGFAPEAPGAPQLFGNAGREHMEVSSRRNFLYSLLNFCSYHKALPRVHPSRAFSKNRRKESSPFRQQSLRTVPERIHSRTN